MRKAKLCPPPNKIFYYIFFLIALFSIVQFEASAQTAGPAGKGVTIRDSVVLGSKKTLSPTEFCGWPATLPYLRNANGSEWSYPYEIIDYGNSIEMYIQLRDVCLVKRGAENDTLPFPLMKSAATGPVQVKVISNPLAGVFVRSTMDTIRPGKDGYGNDLLQITVSSGEHFYFVANGTPPEGGVGGVIFDMCYPEDYYGCWGFTETLVIIQPVLCPIVTISQEVLNEGETAVVTVKGRKQDGTEVDYPAGTEFAMSIQSGGEAYGILVGSGGSGPNITSTSPAQFVVNETITLPEDAGDSVIVTIHAEPLSSGFAKRNEIKAVVAAMCTESPEDNVTINVLNFPECSEPIPDRDLFQINFPPVQEANWKKGASSTKLLLPEGNSFLQVVPCYNSKSGCMSLKIMQVAGEVVVTVGTDYPKVVRSPNQLTTKADIEAALKDFRKVDERLGTVIGYINQVDDNKESMTDIERDEPGRYSTLFSLPNDITYFPFEAYSAHELQHKEDQGPDIRAAYDAAVKRINEEDIGCQPKSKFKNKTMQQILDDLNYTKVETKFSEVLNDKFDKNRNTTELNAYTKQKEVLGKLIKSLDDKLKTL